MSKELYWITYPDAPAESRFYRFRKEFHCPKGARMTARVSADSRYRLYINGALASVGPCKGTDLATYYETVDLTPFLAEGRNRIEAIVLHLDCRVPGLPAPLTGVIRRGWPGFLFDGLLSRDEGEAYIVSDGSWEVCLDPEAVPGTPVYSAYGGLVELVHAGKTPEFLPALAVEACQIDTASHNLYGELDTYVLRERPLPPLTLADPRVLAEDVTVAPNQEQSFILDAGQLTTAYVRACFEGGKGASVVLRYAECFVRREGEQSVKGDRNKQEGVLEGDQDEIFLSGGPFVFESFWFKTFRYLRVTVRTGSEPLRLTSLSFRETHYPIEGTDFACSDESYNAMWPVSVRTLQCCMHETFEDCPYYEQLQYIMDTRLQMLFAYQLSDDYALQRKAIQDFAESRQPSGLLQSRYPCMKKQIIPGFSLHFILMVEDYLLYTGDKRFVKDQLSVIDGILNWFDNRLTPDHLVGPTGYWPYVDWAGSWAYGVPNGERNRPLTVYSMMYSAALRSAASIVKQFGREELAAEYLDRRYEVNSGLRLHCFDKKRELYTDLPRGNTFSQHAQIWAVLCGAARAEEREPLLRRMLDAEIASCSFSMNFYTLRALEKAGMYELSDKIFDSWRELLAQNCTTWPEAPGHSRSDCHAWSAVMLYEFPAMLLGVKPVRGKREIQIRPYTRTLRFAEGTVSTRFGQVQVRWRREGEAFSLSVRGPKELPLRISLPNGLEQCITTGVFDYEGSGQAVPEI